MDEETHYFNPKQTLILIYYTELDMLKPNAKTRDPIQRIKDRANAAIAANEAVGREEAIGDLLWRLLDGPRFEREMRAHGGDAVDMLLARQGALLN